MKSSPRQKASTQSIHLNWIERILIWLAGADPHCLAKCPRWEKVKYEAFGASVLVPVSFGMIGSAYAVSTLTSNLFIIVGFCLVWGFIILTIDRVLLATYRAYAKQAKKITQFCIRITVAVLMGVTVSHPLTLLLFKDTIASEVERSRVKEVAKIRGEADETKKLIDQRIQAAAVNLKQAQQKYEDTISGNFVTDSNKPATATPVATAKKDSRFADIDAQISELKNEREIIRKDLDYWQKSYDDEINGVRSGRPGIGPQARAIESDQLVWRRAEMTRLGTLISGLSERRATISSEIVAQSSAAKAEITARQLKLEKQKLEMFTSQQGQIVGLMKDQVESASAELSLLREEAKQFSVDTQEQIAKLNNNQTADIMTQTIVLHHIFEDPKNGGHFALMVYIVIASLFTLIDTLPLVVKFFSIPGPYDMVQDMEGKRYAPFHELNIFPEVEDFQKQNSLYKQQMESRIDLYRNIDNYWANNVQNASVDRPMEESVPKPKAKKSMPNKVIKVQRQAKTKAKPVAKKAVSVKQPQPQPRKVNLNNHHKLEKPAKHSVVNVSKPAKPRAKQPKAAPRQAVARVPRKTVAPRRPVAQAPRRRQQVAQAPRQQVAQAPRQQVAQAPRQQVAQAPRQQVAQAPRQQVAQAPRPQVAQAPRPQVAQAPRPQVAQAPRPQVAQAPRPQVAQAPRPQVAQAQRPQVAQAPAPAAKKEFRSIQRKA